MSDSINIQIAGNKLPANKEFSREILRQNFPLVLCDTVLDFQNTAGYYPLTLNNEETGVEIYYSELEDKCSLSNTSLTHLIELTYRNINEFKAAAILASVLCHLCDGVVYSDDLEVSLDNSREWASEIYELDAAGSYLQELESIEVSGKKNHVFSELKLLLGQTIKTINILGVWAGGIHLSFGNKLSISASAWAIELGSERTIDVTHYKRLRAKFFKSPSTFDDSEDENAINKDEKNISLAKNEFSKLKDAKISNIDWLDSGVIELYLSADSNLSIKLYSFDKFSEIQFCTSDKKYLISPKLKNSKLRLPG